MQACQLNFLAVDFERERHCTYALAPSSALPPWLNLTASGALITNVAPNLPDGGPAFHNDTWSVVATTPSTTQSISSIAMSCGTSCSFNTASPPGTPIGTITVNMNPPTPAFNGTLQLLTTVDAVCLRAGDTTHLQIAGTAMAGFTLETLDSPTAGTYYPCIQASQTGIASLKAQFPVVAASGTQTLGATSLPCPTTNCTYATGQTNQIGLLSTAMVPASPAFTGSYQLVASGSANGTSCNGGDTTNFTLGTGYPTPVNAIGTAGNAFTLCVQITQATATNSPRYATFTAASYNGGSINGILLGDVTGCPPAARTPPTPCTLAVNGLPDNGGWFETPPWHTQIGRYPDASNAFVSSGPCVLRYNADGTPIFGFNGDGTINYSLTVRCFAGGTAAENDAYPLIDSYATFDSFTGSQGQYSSGSTWWGCGAKSDGTGNIYLSNWHLAAINDPGWQQSTVNGLVGAHGPYAATLFMIRLNWEWPGSSAPSFCVSPWP
jgi:hypothetical protein